MATEYVTVTGVELGAIGIEWPTALGPVSVTLEQLVEIMVAGNDDPLIRPARIKLGHEPWQLHPEGGTVHLGDFDPFWGGEPCFGTAENLRLSDAGRLVGDFYEVPDWLAAVMPSAWPSRSFELAHDVVTEGGQRYERVLTAVALLGVRQHAIKNLADVRRVLDGDPELVEFT